MVDTLNRATALQELSLQRSDMQEHVFFLYSLAVGLRARRIFEIGVCKGVSTRAFLMAVSQLDGKLISVDKGACPEAHQSVLDLGLTGYWDHQQMWAEAIPEKITGPFDLIMIDGNHNYDFVSQDYANCLPLLREGGTLVLHDSNEPMHPGVKKFVGEIWGEWENKITYPWGHGLTVLSGRAS